MHGGGCSADLLGRWTHGWRNRPDVRRGSARPPTEAFAELYFDTVTHDAGALRLLMKHAADDHIVCGSDYPFDMAESDPVGFAAAHGPGSASLTSAARSFLGL
nr:amidohydrolase family protein [Williamsia sp. D3]